MSDRPRLLDLFCGAGVAAMGYYQAGFDVTGVDIRLQPRYPFAFVQADALEYVRLHGHEYDAIHASPPCQGYSRMRHLPWLVGREWPRLIPEARRLLTVVGVPWVIENVEDAPMLSGVVLCGTMFGLKVYRHRRFESSTMMLQPAHLRHEQIIGGRMFNSRSKPSAGGFVCIPDKAPPAIGAEALGIDWMSRVELAQAIPPAYTRFIGSQLLAALGVQEMAA